MTIHLGLANRRLQPLGHPSGHETRQRLSPQTLYAALSRYLSEYTPAKRGRKQEANRIRQWQHSALACRLLASITTEDMARWRNRQLARGLSASAVRNMLTIVSQVYSVAASEWGYEGLANPVAGLRLPKLPPGRDRRLEEGEEARLLGVASELAPWMAPLITLLVDTGMRRSEVLGLEEVRGRVVALRTTKNGRPRVVPLSTRACEAARALLPHLPLSPDQVCSRWCRTVRLAGIRGLTMHDLRHEAISRLFERGLSTEEVMSVSGHRTYSSLARYTHLRAAKIAEKLG